MIGVWVMLATLYSDAILSQEFSSQATCEAAGVKMLKVRGSGFTFICSEK